MDTKWVIFFGEDWGGHYSTGQYLAREIAKEKRVLWVNSLGLRTPKFCRSDILRIWNKLKQHFLKKDHHPTNNSNSNNNIKVITPIAIPLLKFNIVRLFNKFLLTRYLTAQISKLSIEDFLLITACPSTVDIIDKIPAKKRIYYCADEYSALPGMDEKLVKSLELELLHKVDLVVVVSKALEREKCELHDNVHYLPHGVDYTSFHTAVIPSLEIPSEIAHLKTKIVGFVGLLGQHLDMEIIEYIAVSRPNINIVLVGPKEVGISIPSQSNVIWVGSKNRQELPNYLSKFDLCINPYRECTRNNFANPAKVREYLAAGCPVVSTPQSEVEIIGGAVQIANSKEKFLVKIDEILFSNKKINREEISLTMRNQDWRNRAHSLLDMSYSA